MTKPSQALSVLQLAEEKVGYTLLSLINERLAKIEMTQKARVDLTDYVRIKFREFPLNYDKLTMRDKEEIITAIMYIYSQNGWTARYVPEDRDGMNGDYLYFYPNYPVNFKWPEMEA